jgi:membrane-associated HD superfamily phosphohydrolase
MTDQPDRRGNGGDYRPVPDPTKLTQEMSDRLESQLRREITLELRIRDERIQAVKERAEMAEKLRLELKEDNEKNINKALSGVEKANEKLEGGITRTLTQMSETAKADSQGLRRDIESLKDRINDNKERIVGAERQKVGGQEATTERRQSNAAVYAAIGVGAVILSALMGLFGFLAARGGP